MKRFFQIVSPVLLLAIILGTQSALSQWDSTATKLTLRNANQKVGIGTTNPYEKLHINGNTAIDGNILMGQGKSLYVPTTGEGGFDGGDLTIAAGATEDDDAIKAGNLILKAGNGYQIDGGSVFIYPGTASDAGNGNVVLAHNGTTAIGNVGIGTGQPVSKLHVFSSNGVPAGIFQGGNVLINKTSQTNNVYKLDVAGGIRSDSIVVNTTGADFVFAENYDLSSLDKVEKYISENKCLPGIAKAKTMQAEGVNVGMLQIQLLQKVEELTLYLIEQNKRIKKLEEKNLALQIKK